MKGTLADASPGVRMRPDTADYPAYHDAAQNWDDIAWLKDIAGGVPIYLKGVCHIDVSKPSGRFDNRTCDWRRNMASQDAYYPTT